MPAIAEDRDDGVSGTEIARDTDVLEITRTWIFTNDQLSTRTSGNP